MPRRKREKVPNSRSAKPYVVRKQDVPWRDPYEEVHYGTNNSRGTFGDIFKYESFENYDDGQSRYNPCVAFYDCEMLKDVKNEDGPAVVKKGTRMVRIEFRQHLTLICYKPNYFISSSARIFMRLAFRDVEKKEILGCHKGAMGGLRDGDLQLTRDRWIMSLAVSADQAFDVVPEGDHTLIVKFPSLEMEIAGKTLKPILRVDKAED